MVVLAALYWFQIYVKLVACILLAHVARLPLQNINTPCLCTLELSEPFILSDLLGSSVPVFPLLLSLTWHLIEAGLRH